jgi:hypothetical protein
LQARTQHPNGSHAAALHHVEIKARRKYRFPAGEDHGRAIRLGPIQRRVDFVQNLRRQRVALAVVDAHGGNLPIKAVLNGFRCH